MSAAERLLKFAEEISGENIPGITAEDIYSVIHGVRIVEVKLEERSLALAEAQAQLHIYRAMSGKRGLFAPFRGHDLSVFYPFTCTCGWKGRVFDPADVPNAMVRP